MQTQARSTSGELHGQWRQLQPLVKNDSGHGMLSATFGGQSMMVLHGPFKNARGRLYEMADDGNQLRIIRQRTDLDGDAHPRHETVRLVEADPMEIRTRGWPPD